MNKYVVYYESRIFGKSNIHIFAKSSEEAHQIVLEDGIGYSNGVVYADKIINVEVVPPERRF